MKFIGMRIFLVCLIATCYAGCGNQMPFVSPFQAYEGIALQRTQFATVYFVGLGSGGYSDVHGFISSVDQKSTMGFNKPAPLEVHLLPGSHTLGMVAANGFEPRVDSIINSNAKAGHTYELKVKFTYHYEKKYSIQCRLKTKV